MALALTWLPTVRCSVLLQISWDASSLRYMELVIKQVRTHGLAIAGVLISHSGQNQRIGLQCLCPQRHYSCLPRTSTAAHLGCCSRMLAKSLVPQLLTCLCLLLVITNPDWYPEVSKVQLLTEMQNKENQVKFQGPQSLSSPKWDHVACLLKCHLAWILPLSFLEHSIKIDLIMPWGSRVIFL
jgi:hypothetical protein